MDILFTIGHSRHQIEDFLDLLKMHDISVLCDVRSQPYSRFQRQFNRDNLANQLPDAGIQYIYMGGALGGRPAEPCCYVEGKISYALQAKTNLFQIGMEKLCKVAQEKRTAIMCAEKDPLHCHRTWLIAQNLPDMEVWHILADGQLARHADLMGPQQAGFAF